MLCLRAAQDRLVSPAAMDEIQRLRPETSIAILDGPHLILQREPEMAARIVTEWIEALQ